MKATELMIGDWVLDGTDLAQVTSMTCDGIMETTRHNYCPEEVIEPIPLTPEILERNGFRHFEDANAYILMTDDLNCVVLTLNGLTVIFHWHDIPIMCVHQLQHVLRLCGLNELADNFKLEE